MLTALEALERTRARTATNLRRRAIEKPAARDAIEQADRKMQAMIERHAERVRHLLVIDDSILSTRGVRAWEQDTP